METADQSQPPPTSNLPQSAPIPPRRPSAAQPAAIAKSPTSAAGTTATEKASSEDPSPQATTTPQSTGDSAADLQRCQNLAQVARNACNHPASANNNTADALAGGLNNSCEQMQQAGLNNGTANNSAAEDCLQKYTGCMSTCTNSAATYAEQASVSQQFRTVSQQCRALSSQVSQITAQSQGSLSASGAGANCQNNSMAPQSAGGGGSGADNSTANSANSSATSESCSANPQGPGCPSGSAAASTARGESAFQTAKDDRNQKFNLGDSGSSLNAKAPLEVGKGSEPPHVQPINGGGGGGIPGAGGATSASLGGGSRNAGHTGAGYPLDTLDQGLRSGGGYSAPVINSAGDESGPARVPANAGAASGETKRFDLSKFLPGGSLAAAQIGGANISSNGIHGRFVDIWERISVRLQEKCRLGELIDCH